MFNSPTNFTGVAVLGCSLPNTEEGLGWVRLVTSLVQSPAGSYQARKLSAEEESRLLAMHLCSRERIRPHITVTFLQSLLGHTRLGLKFTQPKRKKKCFKASYTPFSCGLPH